MSDDVLPICRVGELQSSNIDQRWLVDTLWSRSAVGFIGGIPKLGKTWLGLDLALSVASGTPCLGRYAIEEPGETLVYLAEDHPAMVRRRLEGLCHQRRLDIGRVPVNVITAPSLRLDLERDRRRLTDAVTRIHPKLLLLDPLIRLHRRDENSAGDVSELLAFLRDLQRACDVAIAVVHHMKKNGGDQAGQALRGSSDLHAWTDSALYLRRVRNRLLLRVEHRSAPSPEPVELDLVIDPIGDSAHLEVRTDAIADAITEAVTPAPPPALTDRIIAELRDATASLTRAELRRRLHVNNKRLGDTLDALDSEQRIRRTSEGWAIR
jgi:hypothetical protein